MAVKSSKICINCQSKNTQNRGTRRGIKTTKKNNIPEIEYPLLGCEVIKKNNA